MSKALVVISRLAATAVLTSVFVLAWLVCTPPAMRGDLGPDAVLFGATTYMAWLTLSGRFFRKEGRPHA